MTSSAFIHGNQGENRLHSAKLLLEQFLMSEKKQTKTPISVDLQQNGPNNIGSMRQITHSIQFKPLLKTPPRLKKVRMTIPQQRSQTTQTIREQRGPSISSVYPTYDSFGRTNKKCFAGRFMLRLPRRPCLTGDFRETFGSFFHRIIVVVTKSSRVSRATKVD